MSSRIGGHNLASTPRCPPSGTMPLYMGISSVPTRLPLAEWARIIGIHPLHFGGVNYVPANRHSRIGCGSAFPQYDWQEADRVSREQIGSAIHQAEIMIEEITHFHLTPAWDTGEWHPNPQFYQPGSRWAVRETTIQANWMRFISGGVERKTPIEVGAALVWAPDHLTGTVTVTVPPGTEACTVEAYYPGHAGDDAYQIRPITVAIGPANVATITIRRELAVREELLEALDYRAAEFDDDGDYLDEVDVFIRVHDPSDHGVALWRPGTGCIGCTGPGCPTCAYTSTPVCLYLRSTPKLSVVGWYPAVWDAGLSRFVASPLPLPHTPDLLRINYLSGWQTSRGCPRTMDRYWSRAVAFLALSLLDRPPCGCSSEIWEYWNVDLANSKEYAGDTTRLHLDNPLGSRRGAVFAWSRIQHEAVPEAATLL